MDLWLAADPPFFGGPGQGIRLQGKSAGIRTQTIVGTAAALFLLVDKYGFSDVIVPGTVESTRRVSRPKSSPA